MSLLTREAILAAADLKSRDVEVPEWGGSVRVREFDANGREAWEAAMHDARETGTIPPQMTARYASLVIVGEDDKPIFTEADIEALAAKSATALDKVFAAALDVNGATPTAVVDAAKN